MQPLVRSESDDIENFLCGSPQKNRPTSSQKSCAPSLEERNRNIDIGQTQLNVPVQNIPSPALSVQSYPSADNPYSWLTSGSVHGNISVYATSQGNCAHGNAVIPPAGNSVNAAGVEAATGGVAGSEVAADGTAIGEVAADDAADKEIAAAEQCTEETALPVCSFHSLSFFFAMGIGILYIVIVHINNIFY
ncbi:hypothetical protein TELCIR_12508 [Teladorsagia circumcincta]|uniref:Uncharacterized protein n=1 Tax=Teladorsagia circumcincta TaxID=45464 RepID=A0A2G9U7Y0_TELCI|nr:hypothetical protein TELCIR_12508 [Teladorsagia circumcincta]